MDGIIIHCDMNNYFASVETLVNENLRDIPFAVCGDVKLRHGIILSKNELAKKYNIITGESYLDALKKCKDLKLITPNYDLYLKYTKLSRSIYYEYSDLIYPYGMDEAWIDVSNCSSFFEASVIALKIKERVKKELGLDIAVGVSYNFLYAKIASDMKSIDSVKVLTRDDTEEIMQLNVEKLLFVGPRTKEKLNRLGIYKINDLATWDKDKARQYLGKIGNDLVDYANGNDQVFQASIKNQNEIKSLGNTITPPKDITLIRDAKEFLFILSLIISKRLKRHNLCCKNLSLSIKYFDYSKVIKQSAFDIYTNKTEDIYNMSINLLRKLENKSIRSISLRAQKLVKNNINQISLFENDEVKVKEIINRLEKKYGNIGLEKSVYNIEDEVKIEEL